MKTIQLALVVFCLSVLRVLALDPQPDSVFVRVVDVGAGLCCVVKMPDNHYMIYDAGDGTKASAKITELIPKNSTIDLLVLSHSDADHIGAVPYICKTIK